MRHIDKSDYLTVYYDARGRVDIRDGLPDKPISANQLFALASQLQLIAQTAKEPLVSHTKMIHYSWTEFKPR